MEALFTALAHYIDFLVLGAIALALFCAPFGLVKPLTDGWQFFSKLVEDSHTYIQAGLISGVFFAVFYFSGYFLNAVGHAFLHRAHFSIIDTTAKLTTAKQTPENSLPKMFPGPSGIFYGRTIPIVGIVLNPLEGDEVNSYWRDAERQVYWGICDWKSFDDMGGGPLTNQLRLLRGLVGLTQILVILCVIAFVLSFFQRYRYVENQIWWSLGTFGVALFLYFFAIVPAYWDV